MFAIEADRLAKKFVKSGITSVLSERPLNYADQKTERGKILNPEYSIFRDQPIAAASPLRINTLLSTDGLYFLYMMSVLATYFTPDVTTLPS